MHSHYQCILFGFFIYADVDFRLPQPTYTRVSTAYTPSRGGFYSRSLCLSRCLGLFLPRRHDRRDGVISASCSGNDVKHAREPRAPLSETLD